MKNLKKKLPDPILIVNEPWKRGETLIETLQKKAQQEILTKIEVFLLKSKEFKRNMLKSKKRGK